MLYFFFFYHRRRRRRSVILYYNKTYNIVHFINRSYKLLLPDFDFFLATVTSRVFFLKIFFPVFLLIVRRTTPIYYNTIGTLPNNNIPVYATSGHLLSADRLIYFLVMIYLYGGGGNTTISSINYNNITTSIDG